MKLNATLIGLSAVFEIRSHKRFIPVTIKDLRRATSVYMVLTFLFSFTFLTFGIFTWPTKLCESFFSDISFFTYGPRFFFLHRVLELSSKSLERFEVFNFLSLERGADVCCSRLVTLAISKCYGKCAGAFFSARQLSDFTRQLARFTRSWSSGKMLAFQPRGFVFEPVGMR